MSKLNGAITAHYLAHWRVPHAWHRQVPSLWDDGDLCIFEYTPKPSRPYHIFATNGMSAHVHQRAGKAWRKELYIYVRTRQDWVVDFLVRLARYPKQHRAAFSTFDTLPVAPPLGDGALPFPAVMLADPQHSEATLGLVATEMPEPVLCDQVVGLCASELQFAEERSAVELWELLKDAEDVPFIDSARQPVV